MYHLYEFFLGEPHELLHLVVRSFEVVDAERVHGHHAHAELQTPLQSLHNTMRAHR